MRCYVTTLQTMMDNAATTQSRIPSVQHSARLSSCVTGSKHPTIREGDLPLSKLLKTSGLVACHQKAVKESQGRVGFTLCINITRSVITVYSIHYMSLITRSLYTQYITCPWSLDQCILYACSYTLCHTCILSNLCHTTFV